MSGQTAFEKPVRPAALCRGETAENSKLDGDEEGQTKEETELSVKKNWRRQILRAGPRNKPIQKEREEHEAPHVPFRDWCAHCMMGRGRTQHHVTKQKSEDQSRRHTIAMDYYFMK